MSAFFKFLNFLEGITMVNELERLSIGELCTRRGAIDDELQQRAAQLHVALNDHTSWKRPTGRADRSVTLLSADRTHVQIAYIHEFSCSENAVMDPSPPSFPPLPGEDPGPRGRGWHYASKLIIPLPVAEAGADAIKAMWDAEEHHRQAESERYEREQYEKLKAKFG